MPSSVRRHIKCREFGGWPTFRAFAPRSYPRPPLQLAVENIPLRVTVPTVVSLAVLSEFCGFSLSTVCLWIACDIWPCCDMALFKFVLSCFDRCNCGMLLHYKYHSCYCQWCVLLFSPDSFQCQQSVNPDVPSSKSCIERRIYSVLAVSSAAAAAAAAAALNALTTRSFLRTFDLSLSILWTTTASLRSTPSVTSSSSSSSSLAVTRPRWMASLIGTRSVVCRLT